MSLPAVARTFAALLASCAWILPAGAVDRVRLQVDDIQFAGARIAGARVDLTTGARPALQVTLTRATAAGHTLSPIAFECTRFDADGTRGARCTDGTVDLGGTRWPLRATVMPDGAVDAEVRPGRNETWHVTARQARGEWQADLRLAQADVARLKAWLPADQPVPTKGVADVHVTARFPAQGPGFTARADLRGVSFSDAAGMRAGEALDGIVQGTASRQGSRWRWQGSADWNRGQVFWQPVYIAQGGHRLSAAGTYDGRTLQVDDGRVSLAQVGNATFHGAWTGTGAMPHRLSVRAADVDMASLYPILLKPFLEKSAAGNLDVKGRLDLVVQQQGGTLREVQVGLRGGEVRDLAGRFAVAGIELRWPWRSDRPSDGVLAFGSSRMWGVPVGPLRTQMHARGQEFSAHKVSLPVLDGRLELEDLKGGPLADGWTWTLQNVALTPVSLHGLAQATGWPDMAGALSGVIPSVVYAGTNLRIDGAVLIKAFDGTVVAKDLNLADPAGRVPRLTGSLEARNLDLDVITRTYSFGRMQGRVDADVKDLELINWRPVRFDARVASSPGRYPKKISQQAVQNISSLGGAGATAAIQRSMLRIFEQFGYSELGLSCALRNNVCRMGGVSDTPQGYVIVKGGGIPAITVMGYNRAVGWEELLQRLARVTQDNVKPIIK